MVRGKSTDAPTEKEVRDGHIRESYAFASRTLRETHEEEFNKYRQDHLVTVGITDWEPESVISKRKAEAKAQADEEKARRNLAKLYEKFPSLAPAGWDQPEGPVTPPEG